MRKLHKSSVLMVLVVPFILAVLALTGPTATIAATTPSLGLAATYSILASTYTNTSAGTTITGDVGFTTGPAVVPLGVHTNFGSGAPYATAGVDQGSALSSLNSQACTFTFAAGAINLSTDTTHGTAGVYAPGVYCSSGAMTVGGPLSLSGNGTYIFRPTGALNTTAGAVVTLNGASACDVFWTPSAATTLAANTTFAGTVIDDAGITIGANTTWTGRALSFGETVTSDNDTITIPTCSVPLPIPPATATLHVIKQVVNNNGGTALASAFNLHVKLSGADVSGSPAVGTVTPGTSYTLTAGTYVVSEDANALYAGSFSGDCDATGNVTLASGADKTCTITNDDIAPTPPATATLHVIKQVVNNNGGTALASAFNLHVKLSGADVSGSPATGVITPGTSYTLNAGTYVVSEDANALYAGSFSGDCDATGNVTLASGADKTCTITNTDIPTTPSTAPTTTETPSSTRTPESELNSTPTDTPTIPATSNIAPKLPAAGFSSETTNNVWNVLLVAGALMLVATSVVVALRKRAV